MKLVKICGITNEKEVGYINQIKPDFMGIVQFFPKSKRNISSELAKKLVKMTCDEVKTVAVTVMPSKEQVKEIIESGFDYIQIHGDVEEIIIEDSDIPVIKAFNVNDLGTFGRYSSLKNVAGFIFDSHTPGSGKTFDVSVLSKIPEVTDKFSLLAGGLSPDNVKSALECLNMDGADTSSGVECENGTGKSKDKISDFVRAVRSM